MKKIWKALGLITLAAAVVPVRIKKDEESGKKTYQSLLWKLDVGSGHDGEKTEIGLDLAEGVLTAPVAKAITVKKETALFADDEPEAAVVPNVIDFAQAAEAAQAAADESQTDAEEVQAAVEEATEEDFDPEM